MTYAAHPTDFPHYHRETQTQRDVQAKPGILRRLYLALHAYRQKEADRQIAAFMARSGSGGRFTDSFERELSRRIATGDWERRSSSDGF